MHRKPSSAFDHIIASAMVPRRRATLPQRWMSAGHQRPILKIAGDQAMCGGKNMFGNAIVLAPLPYDCHGLEPTACNRIRRGLDHRAEYAKGVKALGARPLPRTTCSLAQACRRRWSVFHAGVAEDVIAGLRPGDVESFLADDVTPSVALVNAFPGIGGGRLDRLPAGNRPFALPEPQRLLRSG